MNYTNDATSSHPALIIFMLDISASMAAKMPDGRPRHVVVQDALQTAISRLLEMSFSSELERVVPRYRLLVLAYSEEVWDLFGGIKEISYFDDEDFTVPELPPMTKTNPAMAFEHVRQVLKKEINKWSDHHLGECPAPMVVHLTDAEVTEKFEDPEPYAQEIRDIKVPDGNVLLSSVYISQYLRSKQKTFEKWEGYYREDSTGDPYGDKLLQTSSLLPLTYQKKLATRLNMSMRPNTLMFYPGLNLDFIRGAFVLAGVSGSGGAGQAVQTDTSESDRGSNDVFPE